MSIQASPISKKTAILLFALSPAVQHSTKRILHERRRNVAFWENLHQHCLSIIGQSRLPYFIFDESNQIGDNFGQRLSSAMEEVFSRGYDQVIAIGNDCPSLQVKVLHHTIQQLSNSNAVLGKDRRGGIYLMGLTKEVFAKYNWKSLAWQSDKIYDQIHTLLSGQVTILTAQYNDLHTHGDLHVLLATSLLSQRLLRILASFFSLNCCSEYVLLLANKALCFSFFNKGSPISID